MSREREQTTWRPGPQPWNFEIAATVEEQLRRAQTPRPTRRERRDERIRDIVRAEVAKDREDLDQLAAAVAMLERRLGRAAA